MYGLGSLVKSVKKGVKGVVSGAKDFIKSDAGKALGIAALTFGIPGTEFGGLLGRKSLFGAAPSIFGIEGGIGPSLAAAKTKLGLDVAKDAKNPSFGQFAKVFGIGALGGAALQALEASGAEEEDITDVDALRSYLRQGYRQLNPEASDADIDAFVEQNTVEYRANGGRIGYAEGMNDPKTLPKGLTMNTTTKNPVPENALPKEIEMIAKIMMGPGRSGIGEAEDGTMKGYQFFKNQYLPKKVKELSDNFGYSEDKIYKMINTRVREYLGSPGKPLMAEGGRMKYANGSEDYEDRFMKLVGELMEAGFSQQEAIEEARERLSKNMAMGGRMKYAMGDSAEQNAMQASGIMGLPLKRNRWIYSASWCKRKGR
jgi:hypothetical protein